MVEEQVTEHAAIPEDKRRPTPYHLIEEAAPPKQGNTLWWTASSPLALRRSLHHKKYGLTPMSQNDIQSGDIFEFVHLPGEVFRVHMSWSGHVVYRPEAGGDKSCIVPYFESFAYIRRWGSIVYEREAP